MTDKTIIAGDAPNLPRPPSTSNVQAADGPQSASGAEQPKADTPEADKSATNLTLSIEDTGILDRIAEMLAEHAKTVGEQIDSFLDREIAPLKEQIASLVEKIEEYAGAAPLNVSSNDAVGDVERRLAKVEGQIRHIV